MLSHLLQRKRAALLAPGMIFAPFADVSKYHLEVRLLNGKFVNKKQNFY